MEEKKVDSFVFYRSFYEAIEKLPKEEQSDLLSVICHYALDGTPPPENLQTYIQVCYLLIKPQIDANRKRRENGEKGGRGNKRQGEQENGNLQVAESENLKPNEKEDPHAPEGGENLVPELKTRINALYNRRESTPWTDKEKMLLNSLARHKGILEELSEIETLYNSGYEYGRRDVLSLLTNFNGELDKARERKNQRE